MLSLSSLFLVYQTDQRAALFSSACLRSATRAWTGAEIDAAQTHFPRLVESKSYMHIYKSTIRLPLADRSNWVLLLPP